MNRNNCCCSITRCLNLTGYELTPGKQCTRFCYDVQTTQPWHFFTFQILSSVFLIFPMYIWIVFIPPSRKKTTLSKSLLVMPPFEEDRVYCFAHVSLSVCLSVRLLPFRFRSITWESLDLPSSNLVHTSVQGIRGTLLILGSLGQNLPKPFK